MREIKKHIIHCSDSIYGDVNSIRRYHMNKGWRDVGYHFVIKQDGTIEIGRPIEIMGAHCKGHNKNSIGTCLIGRNVFTKEQFNSLQKLHKSLEKIFGKLPAEPHNKYTDLKTCPNFNVNNVIK